jgi:putative nucleic acid binding protein
MRMQLLGCGSLLVLAMVLAACGMEGDTTGIADREAAEVMDSAAAVAEAYSSDAASANAEYKGYVCELFGTVLQSAFDDDEGAPVVDLEGDGDITVRFYFREEGGDEPIDVAVGDKATYKGRCDGLQGKHVIIRGAVIVL